MNNVVEYALVKRNIRLQGLLESTAQVTLDSQASIVRLVRILDSAVGQITKVSFGKKTWANRSLKQIQFSDPANSHWLAMQGATTVEVVLHEYAHLTTKIERTASGRRRVHGREFCRALDKLFELWRDRIRGPFTADLGLFQKCQLGGP